MILAETEAISRVAEYLTLEVFKEGSNVQVMNEIKQIGGSTSQVIFKCQKGPKLSDIFNVLVTMKRPCDDGSCLIQDFSFFEASLQ